MSTWLIAHLEGSLFGRRCQIHLERHYYHLLEDLFVFRIRLGMKVCFALGLGNIFILF